MKFKFLKAVILDWAGTTVDHGSLAPVAALQRVFAENGLAITSAQARQDMGLLKKDQIRLILTKLHGHAPSEDEVVKLFTEFLPRQAAILAQFSAPIDGVPETVEAWKASGLRIGSTTGYTRALLDIVAAEAASRGYAPEASFTPDEVGAGRPAPFMCYQNAIALGVYPLSSFVKIGDTPSDIEEGRNAGMWTIGITRTGNEVGLSKHDWDALPPSTQESLEQQAAARLSKAHYLAGSLSECKPLLAEIDNRLAAGERP